MKKNFIFITVALILLFQVKLFANIKDSAHDFSTDDMRSSHGIGEICKICHTPHNAGSSAVPLWRGHLSSSTVYTLYPSDGSMDATVGQPQGSTKACLTCHDGSIAKGAMVGCGSCHFQSTRHPEYPYVRNTDLSNDHPVSFVYNAELALQDGALQDPSTPVPALGDKTIQSGMLYKNRLECSSCHDVHKTKGDSKTAEHLLLVTNDQDKLCLTCHIK